MAKNIKLGDFYSARPVGNANGSIGYAVYPKGERSHWSIKAHLYPASDGKCFVITMNGRALDARPSLDAALKLVLDRLERGNNAL